jgi:hypothetical protein
MMLRALDVCYPAIDLGAHPVEELGWKPVEIANEAGLEDGVLLGRRHVLQLGCRPDPPLDEAQHSDAH